MTDMLILLILFVVSGLVLVGISIPLILGKIPPNGWYGFRVRKTMENPEIWYPVNQFAGKRLLLASLVFSLAAPGIYFIPGLQVDTFSYAVLIIWVVGFTLALVTTVRFMNKL
jgi:hypothetical protein